MEHIPFIVIILVVVVLPITGAVSQIFASRRAGRAAERADDLDGQYSPYNPPANLPEEYAIQYKQLAGRRRRTVNELAKLRYELEHNDDLPGLEFVFRLLRNREINRRVQRKATLEEKLRELTG